MYETDAEGAYRVLVSELPFDLGPYITPLVIADDAGAMKFMSQGGCQTYLQRVWKGNMVVETPNWRVSMFSALHKCLLVIAHVAFSMVQGRLRGRQIEFESRG
jgi:hypothetical protein